MIMWLNLCVVGWISVASNLFQTIRKAHLGTVGTFLVG